MTEKHLRMTYYNRSALYSELDNLHIVYLDCGLLSVEYIQGRVKHYKERLGASYKKLHTCPTIERDYLLELIEKRQQVLSIYEGFLTMLQDCEKEEDNND